MSAARMSPVLSERGGMTSPRFVQKYYESLYLVVDEGAAYSGDVEIVRVVDGRRDPSRIFCIPRGTAVFFRAYDPSGRVG